MRGQHPLAQVAERPAIKDPKNEDEMLSGGAAADNLPRDVGYGAGPTR
jgi:hypothetical protein